MDVWLDSGAFRKECVDLRPGLRRRLQWMCLCVAWIGSAFAGAVSLGLNCGAISNRRVVWPELRRHLEGTCQLVPSLLGHL